METMYPGKVNSPATTLDGGINDSVQAINVVSGAVLPDAPNIAVIGTGEDAETILYETKITNQLTNITRGFQGTAKAWDSGETIARMFTEYDHAKFKQNIETLESDKVKTASNVGSGIGIYYQKTGVDLELRKLYAGDNKIDIWVTPTPNEMGAAAINRGSYFGANTIIDTTGPAPVPGTIVTVEIWANSTLLNCEVATFYVTSGNNYSTRDHIAIGTVIAGSKKTFSVNLTVETGDFIGLYFSGGLIEADGYGSTGIYYRAGDNIPCVDVSFTPDTYQLSIRGIYAITDNNFVTFKIKEENIKLDDLGEPDDNTDNDASNVKHGLMPKLPFSGNLLSITTVAFNANADTPLYTVPTGKRCILTHAIIVAAGDAGATTTLSIGANGSETDFIPANILSNLDSEYDSVILMPIPNTTPSKIKSYAETTVIEAQVASQSGVAGNKIYLFGILY